MAYNVWTRNNEFHKRVGVLNRNILLLLAIALTFSTAFATSNLTQTNTSDLTASFGNIADIAGSDADNGLVVLGIIIIIAAIIALMGSGIGMMGFSVVIIPLVWVMSGTGGFLPSYLPALVLLVLGIVWALIIMKVTGVR